MTTPTLEKPKAAGCRIVVYELVDGKPGKSECVTVYGATREDIIQTIRRRFDKRRSPRALAVG